MSKIRLLEDRLISQIAAGEVVERPASVVKELVENAIDAGARDVRVELITGGKRRIAVIDDGHGMGGDDALLAFDRHATSKISNFDDLEQVATLGFRGEALAAIAAVSRVELLTATSPGDGHKVRIEGGRVLRAEPASHPRGTRIEVASLFYNVPARKKFMKQPATELRRALEVVQGYALAHPELRFTVLHDGRPLLETTPTRDDGEGIQERIAQVFGRGLAEMLVEIPLEFITEDEAISGFVGRKGTHRGRRLFIYVNRRLVRDRQVLARFYRAVREEWHAEDYPSLFLFLDPAPGDVDVNVHPQKTEVRFRDPTFLDRIDEALRAVLGKARGEEPAPLRVPQAGMPVAPEWEGLGSSVGAGTAPGGMPPGGNPFSSWNRPLHQQDEIRQMPAPYGGGPTSSQEEAGAMVGATGPSDDGPDRIAQASFAPPQPVTIPLSGRSGEVRPFRLLGQYKGTLILLEGPDGLYLIDQHVAHERLLYERLRRMLEEERPLSQNLLTPPLLELGPSETLRLQEMVEPLADCGFHITPMSGQTVALTAIPTILEIDQAEALLQELATSGGEPTSDVAALRRRLLDALAASLACRGAVKMHHPLSTAEMQNMITELFQAEQPYACPHGRPVVLQMGDAELERRFGRR